MNTTISNSGLPQLQQANNAASSGTATALSSNAGHAAGAPPPPKADDQLKLTDSAMAMHQATRADDAAAVDSQRVDRVRQSLANGSYQINPGKIADKLISMEQQLGATGKA
jgi:negative regulator of flagellin synthesis FlgM